MRTRATSVEIRNFSRNSELGRAANQLGLRADAELGVDAHEMALDRPPAHEELVRGCLCRLTARRETCDLAFAWAHRIDADAGPSTWTALPAGQEDLDLVRNRVDVAQPRPVL